MTLGVAVIGYGYWGPNLVRNFSAAPNIKVVAVGDGREQSRQQVSRTYPAISVYETAEEAIADPRVDAVIIATPVSTHYALAKAALERGKHVFVEKPMCRTAEEARDLVALAAKCGRVLMVDHTFLFTGAVQAIADIVRRGDLGKICYFDSMRVNLGLFQPDVNCLWDLAPHDLSIIDHLINSDVIAVEASGYCHIDPSRPDMVYLTAHFADNQVAHFNLSWMSPVKVRRFTIGGTKKMLIWDDLDQDQKIKIYDHGIEFQPQDQRASIIPEYRIGDIFSPKVSRKEALGGVAQHFSDVVQGKTVSVMDGGHGLRVVEFLERAQIELDRTLRQVSERRAAVKRP